MREVYEFRLDEAEAEKLFGSTVGRSLGVVRVVRLQASDPNFEALRDAHLKELRRRRGVGLLYSWDVQRSYSRAELDQAELIHLIPTGAFEPAGEECGTTYDESGACPHCGADRVQTSPLSLDLRRYQPEHDIHTTTLRRGRDIARSIADEIVVSDQLADWLSADGATGFDLLPVRKCGRDIPILEWFQLKVTSARVDAVPPTSFGKNPFDLDEAGEYRCPLGHVAGLNVVSELTIEQRAGQRADMVATRQLSGLRQGLLVPAPSLLISPALFRLMQAKRIKGARYEVAHLT